MIVADKPLVRRDGGIVVFFLMKMKETSIIIIRENALVDHSAETIH